LAGVIVIGPGVAVTGAPETAPLPHEASIPDASKASAIVAMRPKKRIANAVTSLPWSRRREFNLRSVHDHTQMCAESGSFNPETRPRHLYCTAANCYNEAVFARFLPARHGHQPMPAPAAGARPKARSKLNAANIGRRR
jgi:hypothetical protein